ncbi:MAG TPA: MltA domain-containing protein [Rubrivivax sp.]
MVGAILGTLAACTSVPPAAPPQPAPAPAPTSTPAQTAAPPEGTPVRGARWVAADWSALPGFNDDRTSELWPALRRSCQRATPGWAQTCARAAVEAPADESAARRWLMASLQPYRVESVAGQAEGLATGYYEPLFAASRTRSARWRVPVYAPPADLASRRPHWTRQQLDTLPAAAATLAGREIAWIEDPVDLLVLQIQGSGRLRVSEPDGRVQQIRVAFAGHNDQPYQSVGRWLIDQGELRPGAASWPAIKAWTLQNPTRVQAMLWANPRVVYFREEPLPDPTLGPRGAQGVALTPGRSIAVDPQSVPYGTPVWIDTTEPLSSTPMRRVVMAQDTGGAIVGAVRADYFWGWGPEAEAQAGRMKQPLRMWALWPKGSAPPR